MKKLALLVAAGMVFFGSKLYAGETVSAPAGEVSNPINADYGGVDFATSTFNGLISTVAPANLFSGGLNYSGFNQSTTTVNIKTKYRVYGVNFSSGSCFDKVTLWTSTGGFNTLTMSALRLREGDMQIYNVVGSTGLAGASNAACAGFSPVRWPMRFNGNLFWQVSNNGYNAVNLLYWKEPD